MTLLHRQNGNVISRLRNLEICLIEKHYAKAAINHSVSLWYGTPFFANYQLGVYSCTRDLSSSRSTKEKLENLSVINSFERLTNYRATVTIRIVVSRSMTRATNLCALLCARIYFAKHGQMLYLYLVHLYTLSFVLEYGQDNRNYHLIPIM